MLLICVVWCEACVCYCCVFVCVHRVRDHFESAMQSASACSLRFPPSWHPLHDNPEASVYTHRRQQVAVHLGSCLQLLSVRRDAVKGSHQRQQAGVDCDQLLLALCVCLYV